MNGTHHVEVRNKYCIYKFDLNRNITVIRGDSGTGKTKLYEMLANYSRFKKDSGITISCDKRLAIILDDEAWDNKLRNLNDCIVFFDEHQLFIYTEEFARTIKGTNNYYVLITREELYELPYSVEEIYEIKSSGKYHNLSKIYKHNKKHIYSPEQPDGENGYKVLLTEDSHSGFQFYKHYFEGKGVDCFSSGSNAAIYGWLEEHKGESVLVIADGAAFGAEMNRVMHICDISGSFLCLPESGLIKTGEVNDILEHPSKYSDSAVYFSWENYFEKYLIESTSGTPFQYTKRQINPVYLIDKNAKKIVDEVM